MDMKNKTGAQIFKKAMDKRQPLQTVVGANIHCSDQAGYNEETVNEILRELYNDGAPTNDLQYWELEDGPYGKGSLVDLLRNHNKPKSTSHEI